jgi:hypothetical protein
MIDEHVRRDHLYASLKRPVPCLVRTDKGAKKRYHKALNVYLDVARRWDQDQASSHFGVLR